METAVVVPVQQKPDGSVLELHPNIALQHVETALELELKDVIMLLSMLVAMQAVCLSILSILAQED